jgi:hypothetical protein
MSDLPFHVSADRFRSFPASFPTLREERALCFLAVSISFPNEALRFLFPVYTRETGNKAYKEKA